MKKCVLENFSFKNKCLVLAFLVSFSLFVSENVFGYKHFKREYITAKWDDYNNCVIINAQVYNYSKANYGFLAECKIAGIVEITKNPYTILEIKTPEQEKFVMTDFFLQHKLPWAKISYLDYKNNETSWTDKN